MRRYANQNTKLGRFFARNDGQLLRGLRREIGVKLYLRPWFRRLVRPFFRPTEPQQWVFLVGCYNSGTTILRDILEAHPQISTLPFEGVRLTSAFPDLENADWPRMMYRFRDDWALPDTDDIARRAKRDWAPWWDRRAKVFLEKSIDHTTRVDWLARHFGNVAFVAITRNGLAVCEGVLRRSHPRGSAIDEVGEAYPPKMVAQQWVAFEEVLEANLLPDRDVHLRYEGLMADPVAHLRRVFETLGLDVPKMEFADGVLTVVDRQYLLEDQDALSIARLAADTREILAREMAPMLSKRGYEVSE